MIAEVSKHLHFHMYFSASVQISVLGTSPAWRPQKQYPQHSEDMSRHPFTFFHSSPSCAFFTFSTPILSFHHMHCTRHQSIRSL
eukprot:c24376_g2_i1 orf=307-558(-)